jgi:hypothetical protein
VPNSKTPAHIAGIFRIKKMMLIGDRIKIQDIKVSNMPNPMATPTLSGIILINLRLKVLSI